MLDFWDSMGPRELWFGVVELRPLDRQKFGNAGWFAEVVTWATDRESFSRNVQVRAETIDMYPVAFEHYDPFGDRDQSQMSNSMRNMIARAKWNPDAFVWGAFYRFENGDDYLCAVDQALGVQHNTHSIDEANRADYVKSGSPLLKRPF